MAFHSNGYQSEDRDLERDDGTNEGGDKPTYLMEHLATFTVSKETGIVYPADGMRRLLQLEKTNGIWSQKMQLCLDRSWVLVMDYETGVRNNNTSGTFSAITTCFTDCNGKVSGKLDSRTHRLYQPRSNGNVQ